MKINTNSWHYRYINFWHFDTIRPKSLCSYFWILVAHLLLGMLCIAAIGIFLWWLGLGVIWLWHNPWSTLWGGLVLAAVVSVIGFAVYSDRKLDARLKSGDLERKAPKPDNLVWAFIKAKKRKVCPLIEYTYD